MSLPVLIDLLNASYLFIFLTVGSKANFHLYKPKELLVNYLDVYG